MCLQEMQKFCNCYSCSFFLFLLLVVVFGQTSRSFYVWCINCYQRHVWPVSVLFHGAHTQKKASMIDVLKDFICNVCYQWHTLCFSLFTVTSNHSIQKVQKKKTGIQKKKKNGRWHRRFKDSRLCKAQTCQKRERNRADKWKSPGRKKKKKKKEKKDLQKKKLIDTKWDSNTNIVAEKLVTLSENIAIGSSSQIQLILLLMIDEAYQEPFLNNLSNNLKLFKK